MSLFHFKVRRQLAAINNQSQLCVKNKKLLWRWTPAGDTYILMFIPFIKVCFADDSVKQKLNASRQVFVPEVLEKFYIFIIDPIALLFKQADVSFQTACC